MAFFFLLSFAVITATLPSALIEELNKPPPPEFTALVSNNCALDPSLRYCNAVTTDLAGIYKSTVVARHLCAESSNPDCNFSFAKIDLRSRPRVVPLYLSFAFFWSYCPSSIRTIDLANNCLHGAFPSEVLRCAQIQSLDLSHNLLVGDVPLAGLASLANLSFLNLSYNRFSECNIEGVELFRRFDSSSFIHSGLLPGDHRHGSEITATILLLVGVLVSVLSVVGLIGRLLLRQRRDKFTTAMLRKATNGFSETNLVRKAEGEDVYIGRLRDGAEIEVHVQRGKAFRRTFGEECRILAQLRHKNVAKVIGWCDGRDMQAVVTEGVLVRSVEEWLVVAPPWKQRLKVMMGVMDGICYLDEHWPRVGYDLRTRSVLLREDIEPSIYKFKVRSPDSESEKVYRLGMFVLEVVANKRPREALEASETGFIDWVRLQCPAQIKKVVDQKMKLTAASLEQIKQVTAVALECTDVSAEGSLTMKHVLRMLRRACAPSSAQAVHGHHHHHHHHHHQQA
ncbi:Leucine-rich repeat family protein [Musa troglodytarum]|uniref:Leucine-rich repeat family protein n=1 Tax=Musa troglodytarum TaxID=320322 RepID=A0A9E7FS29_9LILI|nr:Leucine-rich repeat family protein [Musa troglodytarum]